LKPKIIVEVNENRAPMLLDENINMIKTKTMIEEANLLSD